MGNIQIIDSCLQIGEGIVSPECIKYSDEVSVNNKGLVNLYYFYNDLKFDFFVKKKNKKNLKIAKNNFNVIFLENNYKNIDVTHFKNFIKSQITRVIFNVQYSENFKIFLDKLNKKYLYNISSSSELSNIINLVVDDIITPDFITKNVCIVEEIESCRSAVNLLFPNQNAYYDAFELYSNKNLQSYYSSLAFYGFCKELKKDSRVSAIIDFLEEEYLNEGYNKSKNEVVLLTSFLVIGALIIGAITLRYTYSHYLTDIKNKNILSSFKNTSVPSYLKFSTSSTVTRLF